MHKLHALAHRQGRAEGREGGRVAEVLAEGTGSVARFRTGAGIVADSVPEKELDETRAKARGVLKALEG